jgi:hypothetical protein
MFKIIDIYGAPDVPYLFGDIYLLLGWGGWNTHPRMLPRVVKTTRRGTIWSEKETLKGGLRCSSPRWAAGRKRSLVAIRGHREGDPRMGGWSTVLVTALGSCEKTGLVTALGSWEKSFPCRHTGSQRRRP